MKRTLNFSQFLLERSSPSISKTDFHHCSYVCIQLSCFPIHYDNISQSTPINVACELIKSVSLLQRAASNNKSICSDLWAKICLWNTKCNWFELVDLCYYGFCAWRRIDWMYQVKLKDAIKFLARKFNLL